MDKNLFYNELKNNLKNIIFKLIFIFFFSTTGYSVFSMFLSENIKNSLNNNLNYPLFYSIYGLSGLIGCYTNFSKELNNVIICLHSIYEISILNLFLDNNYFFIKNCINNLIKKYDSLLLVDNVNNPKQRYKGLQSIVNSTFLYYLFNINLLSIDSNKDYLQRMYNHFINIPDKMRYFSIEEEKIFTEKLTEYFDGTFNEDVEFFFIDQLRRICANSRLPQDSIYKDRVNLYLEGPSGVGKTETAKKFAEILGIPFFTINSSILKPEDLMVPRNNTSRSDNLISQYENDDIGLILYFLTNSEKYKNIIIFIDEFDVLTNSSKNGESFESLFKTLLDTRYFKDTYTKCSIDISDVIFIFAANGELLRDKNRKEHVSSLNQRFRQIKFGKISIEQKKKIAIEKFFKVISKARNYDYTQEDIKFIEETIVPYDFEINIGSRILKNVINSYVIHKISNENLNNFRYKEIFNQMSS